MCEKLRNTMSIQDTKKVKTECTKCLGVGEIVITTGRTEEEADKNMKLCLCTMCSGTGEIEVNQYDEEDDDL